MVSKKRDSSAAVWVMLAPYLVFLVMFAVVPIWMALKESVGPTMRNEAGGFKNYLLVLTDYRFLTSLKNTVLYVLISAPIMTAVVLVLSLLLDSFRAKWHQYVRLAYLIPGCYVGAAGVLAWYMALEPIIGPFRRVLNFFGIEKSTQVFQSSSLVFIFAMMAVVSNAGAWIVVQFGGLQEISEEVIEAAKIDGCGNFQLATKIKLPLIKKNVVYMVVLVITASVQLFAEPFIVNQQIGFSGNWSLMQLSYSIAFVEGDIASASAISFMLLAVSLSAALIFIFKSKFFEGEGVEK